MDDEDSDCCDDEEQQHDQDHGLWIIAMLN